MTLSPEPNVRLSDFVRDAVVGIDEQYCILYWNAAAAALLGWTADEVTGQPAPALLRATFPETNLDHVRGEIAASGGWQGEAVCFAKDGRGLVCECNIARLPADVPGDIRYAIVFRDVSERARLQEAGRRLTEELRQSEARLQAPRRSRDRDA